MRNVVVEIERTQHVNQIPKSAILKNKRHTLKTIFAKAGMALKTQYKSQKIPLKGSKKVTIARLRDLLQYKDQVSTPDAWYAYILCVPIIEKTRNGKTYNPLGTMFDHDDTPREACAISDYIIKKFQKTPGKIAYLRTMAHELGHVFNLMHNPKTSRCIMTQTKYFGQPSKWSTRMSFEFEEANSEWLASGPSPYVCPGAKPFKSRPGSHAFGGTDDIGCDGNQATLRLSTRKYTFKMGETVNIRLGLQLKGHHAAVMSILSAEAGTVSYKLRDPDGIEHRFRPAVHECLDQQPHLDLSDAEILSQETLSCGAKGYTFTKLGYYTIEAQVMTATGTLSSNPIEIQIEAPRTPSEIELADRMMIRGMALQTYLGGPLPTLFDPMYRNKHANYDAFQLNRATEILAGARLKREFQEAKQLLDNLSQELNHEDLAQVARLRAMIDSAEAPDKESRWLTEWKEHLRHCCGGAELAHEEAQFRRAFQGPLKVIV